jgi:DNA-directed RNA polymerase specialized sigma24 family protein
MIVMFLVGTPRYEPVQNRRWRDWIVRIGDGDLNALSHLYDESSTMLFSLVLHILGDRRLAEDTLIEIYQGVRRDASNFQTGQTDAAVWLIDLAREMALSRRKKRSAELALPQLSEAERTILQLTWFGGHSVDELSEVFGVSRQQIAAQIKEALKKLRWAINTEEKNSVSDV